MSLLEQIVARAKADKQRIVLPEAEEERSERPGRPAGALSGLRLPDDGAGRRYAAVREDNGGDRRDRKVRLAGEAGILRGVRAREKGVGHLDKIIPSGLQGQQDAQGRDVQVGIRCSEHRPAIARVLREETIPGKAPQRRGGGACEVQGERYLLGARESKALCLHRALT